MRVPFFKVNLNQRRILTGNQIYFVEKNIDYIDKEQGYHLNKNCGLFFYG